MSMVFLNYKWAKYLVKIDFDSGLDGLGFRVWEFLGVYSFLFNRGYFQWGRYERFDASGTTLDPYYSSHLLWKIGYGGCRKKSWLSQSNQISLPFASTFKSFGVLSPTCFNHYLPFVSSTTVFRSFKESLLE